MLFTTSCMGVYNFNMDNSIINALTIYAQGFSNAVLWALPHVVLPAVTYLTIVKAIYWGKQLFHTFAGTSGYHGDFISSEERRRYRINKEGLHEKYGTFENYLKNSGRSGINHRRAWDTGDDMSAA